MAEKKISQLNSATTPLTGTETLPIVQGGATKKITASALTENKQDTLVSGTNIKTINGSSLLGSGDLIVGGLTIGTTAISSGTIGRILYEGTGNKLSESSELYFSPNDGTNPPILTINSPSFGSKIVFNYGFLQAGGGKVTLGTTGFQNVVLTTANTERLTIFSNTGNVGIGTITDAGYKLDVNGTSAYRNTMSVLPPLVSTAQVGWQIYRGASTSAIALSIGITSGDDAIFNTANADYIFNRSNVERFRIGNTSITTSYQINPKVTIPTGTTINYGLNVSNSAGSQRIQLGIDASENGVVTLGSLCDFRIRNLASSGYDVFNINGSTGNVIIEKIATTSTAIPSAKLALNSTTSGFLPPRMTTTQKNAISSPVAGLVVYDTTLNKLCVYTTAWETITSA